MVAVQPDAAGLGGGKRLAAVSATPLPGWFWIVAGAIIAAWIGIEGREGDRARRWRLGLRGGVLGVLGLGVAMEVPFHWTPMLPRLGNPPVEVVGDSLSAGIGERAEQPWPAVLERRHEVAVHNHAMAGATAALARHQAERVTDPGVLVVVAIGGNDVLGGTPPDTFARAIDALLVKLHADGRTVVMLELPLPPFANAYGAAQRRLAGRHRVQLVPKRVMMGVLTSPGATVDTIHLSQKGHELMAQAIWRVIRQAFPDDGS